MKLDLSELVANIGKSYHYEVDEGCDGLDDLRCSERVTGSIDFTNTGRVIVARGSLHTSVKLDCSRCLEAVARSVDVTVEEQLPIASVWTAATGSEEEADEEEADPLFEDNLFDLSEYIRQAVLVQVPMQPLCRDDCRGLCPTCGKNLNEGACTCTSTGEPPRLAQLGWLLEKDRTAG
jgi:uncharacterized protein